MKINVKIGKLEDERTDSIIIYHFKGDSELNTYIKNIDDKLGGLIKEILDSGDFTGKWDQFQLIYTNGKLPAKRILLVGLGNKEKLTLEKIREVIGKNSKYLQNYGVKNISTPLLVNDSDNLNLQDQSQAMVEGCLLGTYQFVEYKTEHQENIKYLDEFTIIDENINHRDTITKGANIGEITAIAANWTRDLVSQPGNSLPPRKLAEAASSMANALNLNCKILSIDETEAMGMGAFGGVAKGSKEPAKFIIIEYNGDQKDLDTIVIVGKGITFDTGGISLKPGQGMERMKTDMSGAAAVLGAIQAAAKLDLPINLVALAPAVENMPGGAAIRPGDVLKSLSGKTIEIISTDAEGRLILADALDYATQYNPKAVINLATLTGAKIVALGDKTIGMFGNDLELLEIMKKAGESSGERVWELPLWSEYNKQIKSIIADVKNTGGRPAGSITAAAFLKKFVNYPWVHLDIAGSVWSDENNPYSPKGATGIGVRILVQFLRDWLNH